MIACILIKLFHLLTCVSWEQNAIIYPEEIHKAVHCKKNKHALLNIFLIDTRLSYHTETDDFVH